MDRRPYLLLLGLAANLGYSQKTTPTPVDEGATLGERSASGERPDQKAFDLWHDATLPLYANARPEEFAEASRKQWKAKNVPVEGLPPIANALQPKSVDYSITEMQRGYRVQADYTYENPGCRRAEAFISKKGDSVTWSVNDDCGPQMIPVTKEKMEQDPLYMTKFILGIDPVNTRYQTTKPDFLPPGEEVQR